MIRILTYSLLVIILTPFCSQKKNTEQSNGQLNQSDTTIYEDLGQRKTRKDSLVKEASLSNDEGNEKTGLNLDDLQGIWYSEQDVNFSYGIFIINKKNLLKADCIEGVCENYEETGDQYLHLCESYVGFRNTMSEKFYLDSLKESGKYLVCQGKTHNFIGFDNDYAYNMRFKWLTTSISMCGGTRKNDNGEIVQFTYHKQDTIPSDLRRSLIKLSKKEGRDYIKEYGL
ncbi:MAG: hypothetical protein AAF901_13875 [Bacteroidota bacterium]